MARKKTPNLMDQVLGSSEPPGDKGAGIQESEIKHSTALKRPSQGQLGASLPMSQQIARLRAQEEKIKATFYLSPEIVDRLEAGWSRLRRQAGPEARGRISKSLLADLALAMLLEDLEQEESRLAQLLLGEAG